MSGTAPPPAQPPPVATTGQDTAEAARNAFAAAQAALNTIANANGYITGKTKDDIKNNLTTVQTQISEGINNLINLADTMTGPIAGGGKKKDRKQKGGAVPDLINNVAPFQNFGSILNTSSPLDNAQREPYGIHTSGSYNAGIFMPVSSGAGLPTNYRLAVDQPVQTGGKSKKNNKKNNKN